MKLELKHWAAYLPYGLKVKWGADTANLIGLIRSAVVLNGEHWNESQKTGIENVKLILHPLSDLTTEIEVNGEKFIPIEELLHEINSLVVGGEKYSNEEMLSMCNNSYYSEAWITDRLTEWNFDIFGLIDAGLAVDINTVKF